MLAGVTVPVSGSAGPSAGQVSHLEAIREELVARYSMAPRPAAPGAVGGPAPVIQDPDQRPPQAVAARAASGATEVIQDPDEIP